MKKGSYFGILLLILLVSINLSNATIILSDVNSLYNLGDKITLSMKINPQSIEGKFEINLVCGTDSINIERMTAESRFVVGKEVSYSTLIKLQPEYIEDLKGECVIKTTLAGESSSTKTFKISDKLILTADLNKKIYNPGEEATIILGIKKETGESIDGFFESEGILNIEKPFYDGKLIEKFIIPKEAVAGDYEIRMIVYDSFNGIRLNQQESSAYLSVASVPTSLNIAISHTEINPGNNITISPELKDQSGAISNEIVSLTVSSPDKKVNIQEVKSGESIYISIPNNALPGKWIVKGRFSTLTDERSFIVDKLGKIETSFLGDVLVIKNIGNWAYTGNVEVKIGEQIQIIDISNLAIGAEKRYSISAPNGEYSIIIKQDKEEYQTVLSLTGATINIKEISGPGLISRYPFLWIIILIILLVFAIFFGLRLKKTPFKLIGYLKNKTPKRKERQIEEIQVNDNFSLKTMKKINYAEHTLVLNGEKQTSAVISIRINNLRTLTKNTKEEILKIISNSDLKNGVIEENGEYFLIIFNPKTTKSFANESDASEVAFRIFREISALNKKILDKFDFGIGLNKGDLIAKIEGNKLKYTSIGNTILLAKKMADLKENKIYTSEEFRKKLLKDLRVEKVSQIGNIQIYNILNVATRTDNSLKLDDLLKRIHE